MSRAGLNIVICAAQVPLVAGGAEVLVDGLAEALRQAGHCVEIVALPFKWYPRDELERQPLLWRLQELDRVGGRPVDLVICTKYPTWAVRHPHKVVWLVHQYRQAYDWYGTPRSDFGITPEERQARRLILETDSLGLGEARAIYTISKNVANRLMRYNGLRGIPLYPPLKHDRFYHREYGDYIFSISRLDSAKRLDLLLESIAQSKSGVRAVIAGSGPDLESLKEQARKLGITKRVEFTGRVSDDKAVELYAGALAVYYAPYDEDYGYASLEGMRSSKAVLTAPDSGGVLEFVTAGENGFVCASPAEFAASMDRLYTDRELVARLGNQARQTSNLIPTWEEVARTLAND